MKTLTLNVTQEDIDTAIEVLREDKGFIIENCAVSQAAKREKVADFSHTSIDGMLVNKFGLEMWDGGKKAENFIKMFDDYRAYLERYVAIEPPYPTPVTLKFKQVKN